jgi:membrane protein DedA with SNARE-associated domain
MQGFLIKYGLIAVFLGAMFEGDIVVPTAGALASFGYHSPVVITLVCISGMFAGDCMWYWLGRIFGKRLSGTKLYKKAMPKAEKLADKMGVWQIAAARFIWGARVATMIFWGFKRLNFAVFAAIDLLAVTVFTTALVTLGYYFSRGLRRLVGDVEQFQYIALGAIAVIMVVFILARRWRHA